MNKKSSRKTGFFYSSLNSLWETYYISIIYEWHFAQDIFYDKIVVTKEKRFSAFLLQFIINNV